MFNINKDQVLDHKKFHFIFGSIKYRLKARQLPSWHYYKEFLFEIISYPFRICFEQPKFLNNFKNSIKDINIETKDKDRAILNKQKKIVEESLKIKTFVKETGLNLNFSNNEKNIFDSLQEILDGINKRIEFLTSQEEPSSSEPKNILTSATEKLAASSVYKSEIKASLIETKSSNSENFIENHISLSLTGLEIDSNISKKQKCNSETHIDEQISSSRTPSISKLIAIENPKETSKNIQTHRFLIDTANESVKNYKKNLLESLSQNIEKQKKKKTYMRPQLKSLEKQVSNVLIPLASSPKKVEFSKTFSETATFYGYNAEGIRDCGWGCAWRTIQTCLSAYKINPTFEELFHLFGPFENLKHIYKDKYPEKILSNSKLLAPYDVKNGWAEPFIGHMVMHFCGIPSTLEKLNDIPGNCNAPQDVFHNKTLNFESFKERLNTHFESEAPAPIMIDDGLFALNIVGVKSEGSNTTLWIADPHIKEGVNKSIDTEKSPAGLYTVTLDGEGKQISCSLADQDKHQVESMYSKKSYEGLQFDIKPWMILFPMKP